MFDLFLCILGAVISVVIGIIYSDPIRNFLKPLVSKIKPKTQGIDGIWEATFEYPCNDGNIKKFTERIEIKSVLNGYLLGEIISHRNDYQNQFERNQNQKILRLHGEIRNDTFFTGTWIHPLSNNNYHGVFFLKKCMNGENLNGIWVGFSDVTNSITQGKWDWKKIKN